MAENEKEDERLTPKGHGGADIVTRSKLDYFEKMENSLYPPLPTSPNEAPPQTGHQAQQRNKKREITPERRQKAIEDILTGSELDYERILGVKKDDTEKRKLKAYRKKALLVHPDRNPKAPGQAKEAWTCKFDFHLEISQCLHNEQGSRLLLKCSRTLTRKCLIQTIWRKQRSGPQVLLPMMMIARKRKRKIQIQVTTPASVTRNPKICQKRKKQTG
jgi:hypothetical protein